MSAHLTKKALLSGLLLSLVCLSNGKASAQETAALQIDGISIPMVLVPGGTLQMDARQMTDGKDPIHACPIEPFYLAAYELTQDLWTDLMEGKYPVKYGPEGARYPVTAGYTAYCELIRKLNDITGLHFFLPTESQWEFAFNEGKSTSSYRSSGSKKADEVAWMRRNSPLKDGDPQLHEVGLKKPNALGLYDMSGNVGEFCWNDLCFNGNLHDYMAYSYRGGDVASKPKQLKGRSEKAVPDIKGCRLALEVPQGGLQGLVYGITRGENGLLGFTKAGQWLVAPQFDSICYIEPEPELMAAANVTLPFRIMMVHNRHGWGAYTADGRRVLPPVFATDQGFQGHLANINRYSYSYYIEHLDEQTGRQYSIGTPETDADKERYFIVSNYQRNLRNFRFYVSDYDAQNGILTIRNQAFPWMLLHMEVAASEVGAVRQAVAYRAENVQLFIAEDCLNVAQADFVGRDGQRFTFVHPEKADHSGCIVAADEIAAAPARNGRRR